MKAYIQLYKVSAVLKHHYKSTHFNQLQSAAKNKYIQAQYTKFLMSKIGVRESLNIKCVWKNFDDEKTVLLSSVLCVKVVQMYCRQYLCARVKMLAVVKINN